MANKKPFLNIGPGEFIKEEMEFRSWTNEDLAQVLNLSSKTISELLNNKQRITLDTARILSKAFGQSPQYWLNLDNNYRLRLDGNKEGKEVEVKSCIYERMPVNDMIKKGWIKKYKKVEELKNIFMKFWEIDELDYTWLDTLAMPKTRKSTSFDKFNKYYLLSWTQMAKKSSEKFRTNSFKKEELKSLAKQISDYTIQKNGVANFLDDLTKTGVKFFVLSHLPRTYLDGASFKHEDSPVIVYTKRYDRLDNFWFTIAHEIGHVLLHIKNEDDVFVDDLKIDDNSLYEKEANEFASDSLKTQLILKYFSNFKKYTSEKRVNLASDELNIHKSIIAGILKYHDILAYNRLNKLNEIISDKIPKKYLIEST